jgi:CysZ protein
MKAFIHHFHGIKITLTELFKGKYLAFFIPGIVISLFYWVVIYYTTTIEAPDLIPDSGISWIDTATGWIDTGASYVVGGFMWLFTFILDQVYIFIIITALSPFNTALAEKFDGSLTGFKVEFNLVRFINDFIRMVFVVILAIVLEFTFIAIYWVISWILGLDEVDPYIYNMMAAFFFGFSFYDFALERYEVGVFGSLGYAFSKPLSMMLTGGLFMLIYHIPYVGIPLAPVLAVMISTVVYLYNEKKLPKAEVDVIKEDE